MRNVLFPSGRAFGSDLASKNIQRGRDHGLPDYNSVRKGLGLEGWWLQVHLFKPFQKPFLFRKALKWTLHSVFEMIAILVSLPFDANVNLQHNFCKFFFFQGLSSFSQITKDTNAASKMKDLYQDINNIDLWVGGLAEDHESGSELGPTFRT